MATERFDQKHTVTQFLLLYLSMIITSAIMLKFAIHEVCMNIMINQIRYISLKANALPFGSMIIYGRNA